MGANLLETEAGRRNDKQICRDSGLEDEVAVLLVISSLQCFMYGYSWYHENDHMACPRAGSNLSTVQRAFNLGIASNRVALSGCSKRFNRIGLC